MNEKNYQGAKEYFLALIRKDKGEDLSNRDDLFFALGQACCFLYQPEEAIEYYLSAIEYTTDQVFPLPFFLRYC
jgi:tetratricopeptide (TPR) repeat protein